MHQFSFVSGAVILYACSGPIAPARTARLAQIGYQSFGICFVSFILEQLFYLSETASLVPKWIPPGQMFWVMATTAAFALAEPLNLPQGADGPSGSDARVDAWQSLKRSVLWHAHR
jgi:hypothetical protein